jgi:hypothetical protein
VGTKSAPSLNSTAGVTTASLKRKKRAIRRLYKKYAVPTMTRKDPAMAGRDTRVL